MTSGPPPPHPSAKLTLLGPPSLKTGSGSDSSSIGPGKSLALLSYLAVRRQVRRDELMSLLWGEMADEPARNAFRQALHRIRKSVSPDILVGEREQLSLGGPDAVTVDRDQFLADCEAGRWQEAVSLYHGDFLEGFTLDEAAFDRWVDTERMQLRSRFQGALRQAAEAALRSGDAGLALQNAARLSASAPLEPDAALFQANILLAAGKSAEALTSLRGFVSRLQSELELSPPGSVTTLITRLERNADGQTAPLSGLAPDERKALPLIGRESEMARLLSAVVAARSERGSAVLIESEAGMGRTRLLDELRSRVLDLGGIRVLRGRERVASSVVPYASLAEALRPLTRAAGVSGASRHLLAEAARLLPELRDSFDLPEVTPVEDAASRLRFFEGVAAAMDAAAYERPLCVLLDDVHHTSAASLDLLTYLIGRLRTSPVTFVLSARNERSQLLDRLRAILETGRDDSFDTTIALGPLADQEIADLVAQVSRGAAANTDRIVRKARGRPAVAIDLARRAAAGEDVTEAPTLLRDVLWARLQSSAPSQRRVFFAAALLDRNASLRLLSAAAHLTESATQQAASELAKVGLLREDGSGFVVAHSSTVGFVEEASGIAGRALLAGWAADALSVEEPGNHAELAQLYSMAGRAPLAFSHARLAAFAAAGVGATSEAIHHLGVALSFAADERSRVEIESLLRAYGEGRLLLSSPAPDAASVDAEEAAASGQMDVAASTSADSRTDDPAAAPRPQTPPSVTSTDAAPVLRRASAHQWYMSVALSAIVILLGLLLRRSLVTPAVRPLSTDSLVVSRRDPQTGDISLFAVALSANGKAGSLVPRGTSSSSDIAWLATLPAPWTEPLVSPTADRVALELVTSHGKDLYVISANRRDTIPLVVGGGDNLALGWSPDGRALLVSRSRTAADGSYDSDLYAFPVVRGAVPTVIDSSSARSVAEAKWSPTGLDIAWVARVGATRQRDIFVSRANGVGARNITHSPGDDFELSWSPDGSLLAFTSTSSGAPRIYTYDFENQKTWSVSDRDGEDHAVFSPDGRLLAFEAARAGDAGIYVRPALGGAMHRLTPPDGQYTLGPWTTQKAAWIDRVRILGATTLAVGDTARLNVLSVSASGAPVSGIKPVWVLPDSLSGVAETRIDSNAGALRIVARHEGALRVIASLPGWRADTISVLVASGDASLNDRFLDGIASARWISVGEPAPLVAPSPLGDGGRALFPNADLEWDSGVLSRSIFELEPGSGVSARVIGPFVGPTSAASVTVGFVGVGPLPDARSPQVAPVIAASWDGQSAAFHYVAGRESFADLTAVRTNPTHHDLSIRIAQDSTVVFSVDGLERWRSSLSMSGQSLARVQLWIGGRASGSRVAVTNVAVSAKRR